MNPIGLFSNHFIQDLQQIANLPQWFEPSSWTETMPMEALKKVLNRKRFELLVVNIDNKNKHNAADAERLAEEAALYGMLQAYDPQYFFVNDINIISSVLQFASDKEAQLVIALPHKYSFLQSLIHTSVSQQLIESSAVPILILK